MKNNKHLFLWSIVPVVLFAEIFQQWRIPRKEPAEADWKAAVQAVAEEKKPSDLLVIAPSWAVQGRMYFKSLISWKDFGRFDTTAYRRIFEVSMNGEKSPETATLTPEKIDQFGQIRVSQFVLRKPDKVIYDFSDHLEDAISEKYIERKPKIMIDHWFFPRRVVSLSLGTRMSLTFENVPLKGVLRGYGIIGYREARFNKGGPVRLSIFVNDRKIGQEDIANFGPLRPFEYRLSGKGTGTVKFESYAKNNKKREFGFQADVRIRAGR